ncbi:hypothetical protein [Pseudolysinimonas sp.]
MTTTRLLVDFRPNWYQVMELPVSSREVRERMEQLAASALRQFVHQQSVTVTAIASDGFAHQITRYRGEDRTKLPTTCPHCGNFL